MIITRVSENRNSEILGKTQNYGYPLFFVTKFRRIRRISAGRTRPGGFGGFPPLAILEISLAFV
jgi:hypothetical protein